ncbi:MAG TPA: CvpA family protein [Candidatus Dormibacteraeota bacterium]|nr:CvpA family protein [Candidatus Dormibacteraeota bacterium]
MIFDILIVIAVVAAVAIGFRRGMIQPILFEIGFVLVLWIGFSHWNGITKLFARLHLPGIVAALVLVILAGLVAYGVGRAGGIVHRMPLVQGWDGLLGVFVHGLIAILACYFVLSTMVAMGKALGPSVDGSSLDAAQVRTMRYYLLGNPILARVVSKSDLRQAVAAAKQPGGAQISQFTSLHRLQSLYGNVLESQLADSHLAPVVFAIGDHVPFVGHFGPSDLPSRAAPSPSPSVSPSASPTAAA